MSRLNDNPWFAARKLGRKVVLPGPRDLFVDIDTEADYLWLKAQLNTLAALPFGIRIMRELPSKSGLPRRHVYLKTTRVLTPVERIALQACLGSDRKRELLSMMRVYLETKRPATIFFEAPEFEPPGEKFRRLMGPRLYLARVFAPRQGWHFIAPHLPPPARNGVVDWGATHLVPDWMMSNRRAWRSRRPKRTEVAF